MHAISEHEELRLRCLAGACAGALLLAIGWILPRFVAALLLIHITTGALLLRSIAMRVRERGVLHLLPASTQSRLRHALTHTTLLELIRDDSLIHHVAPYLPLALNLNDAEMALYLDSAPLHVRNALTSRGLSHALPPRMLHLLVGTRGLSTHHVAPPATGVVTAPPVAPDVVVPSALCAAATAPLSHGATWPSHVISAVLRRRVMTSLLHGMDSAGMTQGALAGGAVIGASLLLLRLLLQVRRRRSPLTAVNGVLIVIVAGAWVSLLLRSRASASLREFDRLRMAKAVQAFEAVLRYIGGQDAMRAAAPYLNLWARTLGTHADALWQRMGAITGVPDTQAGYTSGGASEDDATLSTPLVSQQLDRAMAPTVPRDAVRQSMTWLAQRRGAPGAAPPAAPASLVEHMQAYLAAPGAGNGIAAVTVALLVVLALRRR